MGNKPKITATTCPRCGRETKLNFLTLMNDLLAHPENYDDLKTLVSTKRKQSNIEMRIKCPYCGDTFVVSDK